MRHNALNLTDQHGGLLATTEPIGTTGPQGHAPGATRALCRAREAVPGTIFRLRIAPQADAAASKAFGLFQSAQVGLALCALICLQHLS